MDLASLHIVAVSGYEIAPEFIHDVFIIPPWEHYLMPDDNNFRHAKYSRSDPGNRVKYLTLETGAQPFSPAWNDGLGLAGKTLHEAGVQVVMLLYGSYFGTDLFGSSRLDEVGGLKRGYSRGIPGMESLLALLRPKDYQQCPKKSGFSPPYANNEATKIWLDQHAKDRGNFTADYERGLREGFSSLDSIPITCVRYLWSSLNHHLGRMEGAFALFHEIKKLKQQFNLDKTHRILILAHGHAGQLVALLSNLLAQDESSVRDELFETLARHYGQFDPTRPAIAPLQELDQFLANNQQETFPALDVVTLGTSVRYGWNTNGIGKLLHVVNHRPMRSDGKKWLAKMDLPQIVMEMPMLLGGDYVQQLAVASTDAIPSTPLDEELNQALQENLEPYYGFERWLECARRVTRCPNDGECLLLDYVDTKEDSPSEHLYGHGCYTRLSALLFQTRQIVKTLYS